MSADELTQVAAVLAVLGPALSPIPVYDIGKVSTKRPAEYVEVMVQRRFGGEPRLAGGRGLVPWRVFVRGVSQVSADNARRHLTKANVALDRKFLTVAGESHFVEFEGAEIVGPDESWFSGSATYIYTT